MRRIVLSAVAAVTFVAVLANAVVAGASVFVIGGINLANHNQTFLQDVD